MSEENKWAVGIYVDEQEKMFVSLTVASSEMRMGAEAAWMIANALNQCAQYAGGAIEEAPDA